MSESIPAIRLTDPHDRHSTPLSPPTGHTQFASRTAPPQAEGGALHKSTSPKDGKASAPAPGNSSRPMRSSLNTHTHAVHDNTAQVSSATNGAIPAQAAQAPQSQSPIDPLSQHILKRTNTATPQSSLPGSLKPTVSGASGTSDERHATADDKDAPSGINLLSRKTDTGLSTQSREKKKGVSFLSRIIGNKKKDSQEDLGDDSSEYSELRPEGTEAQVFAHADSLEYTPRQPQPPAYIKVEARHKKKKEFDRVFLAQELSGTGESSQQQDIPKHNGSVRGHTVTTPTERRAIWALQFSKDGKYMAAAGADKIVRVWAVITGPDDRTRDEESEDLKAKHVRLSAPVFRNKPVREFDGHTATVLDLSWSKNNFLLSSSMDKTVRLWHVSRNECLCTFKHNDFVTSIAFHPKDDRFFLAGSLDSKLRLWSIPDKTVAFWNQLPEMITAVAFTPDGRYAIAGCLGGLCMFYETEGLKYQSQIHVRSTHGKNAKGNKITSIQAIHYPPHTISGDTKLLITSNDSRIRIYNFRDKAMETKLKGHVNDSSQIRASFSDDVQHVICGSEDHKIYIWPFDDDDVERKHKRPLELFEASNTTTTCVVFAPTKTRQLLGRSQDPIYDVCNPPPVTLMSNAERAASGPSSRTGTEFGDDDSINHPPEDAKPKRAQETPAYIARSTHSDGQIIVTADFSGNIKVFRQDCAFAKRRNDFWETSSMFSRAAKLGRTASVATKGSSRSLRSAQGSTRTQEPSDRILSWRQGITSTASVAGSIRSGRGGRSPSPRKNSGHYSTKSSQTRLDVIPKEQMGPPPLPRPKTSDPAAPSGHGAPATKRTKETQAPPSEAPRDDDKNPLQLQGSSSLLFWKLAQRTINNKQSQPSPPVNGSDREPANDRLAPEQTLFTRPPAMDRIMSNISKVSTLSIDHSDNTVSDSDESFKDALESAHAGSRRPSESDVICKNCQSNSFKAVRHYGSTRLVCTHCGTAT